MREALPHRLPNRRLSFGEKMVIEHPAGMKRTFYLHFDFDAAGMVRAVHFHARAESSDLITQLTAACNFLSKLLQSGWVLAELAQLRCDVFTSAILERGLAVEVEEGPAVPALYARGWA